jgi:ubiquinone/menaquinone biosynthesis C-methylase UbiE
MREPSLGSPDAPGPDRQERVDRLFTSTTSYWRTIYDEDDVDGWIFRRREAVAAGWIRGLARPPDQWAVELGCGVGLLSAGLAEHGIAMQASDRTEAMVRQAQATAADHDVAGSVTVVVADVHDLPWASGRARVVAALGVLPWLHAPERALGEMARILGPGGHLVVTADNSVRLSFLLDPARNPVAGPPRRLVSRLLRRLGLLAAASTRERYRTPRQVDRLVRRAGLEVVARTTVGFGPFTMLGRRVLSTRRGMSVQRYLQRLADRGVPVVRSLGNHYMALAAKPTVPAGSSAVTEVTATGERRAP